MLDLAVDQSAWPPSWSYAYALLRGQGWLPMEIDITAPCVLITCPEHADVVSMIDNMALSNGVRFLKKDDFWILALDTSTFMEMEFKGFLNQLMATLLGAPVPVLSPEQAKALDQLTNPWKGQAALGRWHPDFREHPV